MSARLRAEFGALDILVNNAGIQHVAKVEDFPPERWDAIIAINLTSAFHTTRLALPGMKQRNWGRILNIASTHGLVASAREVGLRREPSTASSASPRAWRSRRPPPASPATPSAPAGC